MAIKGAIFFLLLQWLSIQEGFSQYIPTVVEGNKWRIGMNFGLGNISYHDETIACDTLIQGQHYLMIYYDYSSTILGFVREDTSKQEIFYLTPDAAIEKHIITYKGEIGDTLYLDPLSFVPSPNVITDISYDTLYGKLRKILEISSYMVFIEGVGCSVYGINGNFGPLVPMFLNYFEETNSTCEQITADYPAANSKLSISPNPFDNFISISNQNGSPSRYELFDLNGILLLSGIVEDHANVNTGFLAPGIYILRINGKAYKVSKI